MTLSKYCFRNFAVWLLLIASVAGCTETGDNPDGNTDSGVMSDTEVALQSEESRIPDATSQDSESKSADSPIVLFLGDSITAGYGIKEREAFPFLVGQRFFLGYFGLNIFIFGYF